MKNSLNSYSHRFLGGTKLFSDFLKDATERDNLKKGYIEFWCGVNKLGNTSALVNPTVQLLLTRRGKIRMDGIGIVFEFYIAPL